MPILSSLATNVIGRLVNKIFLIKSIKQKTEIKKYSHEIQNCKRWSLDGTDVWVSKNPEKANGKNVYEDVGNTVEELVVF